jgi:hypothetical protein
VRDRWIERERVCVYESTEEDELELEEFASWLLLLARCLAGA